MTENFLTRYPYTPIHVFFLHRGHVLAQVWLMRRAECLCTFVFQALHCAHDAVFDLEWALSSVTRASRGVYLGMHE